MDTVGARSSVGQDRTLKLTVPPGFVSHTAFTLRRMAPGEDGRSSIAIQSERDLNPGSIHVLSSLDDDTLRSDLKIKCRPWILHDHFDQNINNDHNEEEQQEEVLDVGQIHEEDEGFNVEQSHEVSAQRDPSGVCPTRFEEAPVFQPTHEEFKDTLKYLESICRQVKPYGFCRIIPPPPWQSPCFGENDAWKFFEFTTQVQRISESQEYSKRKESASGSAKKSEGQRISGINFDDESGDKHPTNHGVDGFLGMGQLQFKLGPHYTLESFKKNADCFKESYFSSISKLNCPNGDSIKSHEHWEPSEEDVECEYWRISEKHTAEIEVFCGADIDARELRSKYPDFFRTEETSTSGGYQDSGWNLNNISNLPDSPFVFGELNYLGNPAPQFNVGMCFSSRPWGIERHWFCTLHYLHSGAPKIWYGVPGTCKAAVKELFSSKVNQCPELSDEQVMQISPAAMLAEGIPVRRCVQQPKEFVLFLPGAYHAGFDCGFNISESNSFAVLDWLSQGLTAAAVYRAERLKMPMSHDRLLFRAAHEAVKANWEVLLAKDKSPSNLRWKERCGKGGVIAKALRERVRSEARQRQYLTSDSQCREMDESFDEGAAKECAICYYHLYISASFCCCNPGRYACLRHARHLCSCAWSDKVFLFRYNNTQLNLLADAVEGKFAACHRWIRDKHGEALDLSQEREGEVLNTSHLVPSKKDTSSADNAAEHKGERKSTPDHISSVEDMSKKLVSESMARILQASGAITMNLDPSSSVSDDSSSGSDDEFLTSFLKEKNSLPSETHGGSSMRAVTDQAPGRSKTGGKNQEEKSADVVCISSDDEA